MEGLFAFNSWFVMKSSSPLAELEYAMCRYAFLPSITSPGLYVCIANTNSGANSKVSGCIFNIYT